MTNTIFLIANRILIHFFCTETFNTFCLFIKLPKKIKGAAYSHDNMSFLSKHATYLDLFQNIYDAKMDESGQSNNKIIKLIKHI